MAVVQPNVLAGIYSYSTTLAAVSTSDYVQIPRSCENEGIMVAVATTDTATGIAQFTASSYAAIVADTATWVDWSQGTVAAASNDYEIDFRVMTGVRFKMTGGAGTVVGQLSF